MFNILVIILFNQLLFIDSQHIYFSDPDLSNPYIPQELRDSCGYRYGVINRQISYAKHCFLKTYSDQNITIPIKEEKPNIRLTNTRVLGGRDVFYREAPWVVQIVSRKYTWYGKLKKINHWCTGVLITMKYILTAAHCYREDLRPSIYAGRDETTEGWRTTDMTWYLHPNYTNGTTYPNGTIIEHNEYDIAIIELNEPIDWHKYGKDRNGMYLINTICLPIPEKIPDIKSRFNRYRKATIFGWGGVGGYERPRILQRGDYLVRYSLFNSVVIFMSMAWRNVTRNCKGDSGSGLIQYIDEYETRAVLIGINVAAIKKKNLEYYPCDFEHIGEALSLRVANYLDWINEYLRKG